MRCLTYVSLLAVMLLQMACSNRYKAPLLTSAEGMEAAALRPEFEKELYRCVIDGRVVLKKFHLSGLLYLRHLPEGDTRVVFQGEMGNTFFDFGWDVQDSFRVFSIIEAMNKPALIKTLKKDFELLLLKNIAEMGSVERVEAGQAVSFPLLNNPEAYAQYVLDSNGALQYIYNGDRKRLVVSMELQPPVAKQLPEHLLIDHKRAHFTIDMSRIKTEHE